MMKLTRILSYGVTLTLAVTAELQFVQQDSNAIFSQDPKSAEDSRPNNYFDQLLVDEFINLYKIADLLGSIDTEGENISSALCKTGLAIAKSAINQLSPEELQRTFNVLCNQHEFTKFDSCTVSNHSNFPADIANTLYLMSPYDLDGEYFCHYFFNGICPMPETKTFNLSTWWPEKKTMSQG